jgi:cob(I)alamin adenosyltransferase
MTRIYTTTGDDGTTGLIGGRRVPKDDPRIEAYGSIDELNAVLGVVSSYQLTEGIDAVVRRIQDDLFSIGADLALPPEADRGAWGIPAISDADIRALEQKIDEYQESLKPLKNFILPGGSRLGAMLHLGRTVARRAERRCVALRHAATVDPQVVRYLNRLSDLLFVLARLVNQESAVAETHPTFGKRNT